MSNLDINKLLDEVEADVKSLLKSAQDDAAKLTKAEHKEESSSSSSSSSSSAEHAAKSESMDKKEESSSSSSSASKEMAKADAPAENSASGYDSQAPEASAQAAPAADPAADPNQEAESMEGILKDLDDDMLHELYQKIKMELMGRMQSQESQDQSQPAQDPAAAAAPSPDMAMQRSEKEFAEKLTKAETVAKEKDAEIEKLKKSVSDYENALGDTLDLVKSVMERPVTRAVTDIQFVNKGEETLNKSEPKAMSDDELKKAADTLAKDNKRLGTLSKSEREVLVDYLCGRPVKEKLVSIINK